MTRIVTDVDGARRARGVVVIIDVMRAFTTAVPQPSNGFDFAMRAERRGDCWTAMPVFVAP